jgi:hypothetical protein
MQFVATVELRRSSSGSVRARGPCPYAGKLGKVLYDRIVNTK